MMRLNERIPNLVSKFILDNILSRVWQTAEKGQNIYKIADFASFRQFYDQKGVKCYRICILRPDLEPRIEAHPLDHKMKGD